MKSKVLKIGTVLLTCVCLISFIVLPVSAVTDSMNPNIEFTGWGKFTNTTTGVEYLLSESLDNYYVYPDNSVFNNAVSIWLPYSSVILNSSQYGYQDIWINPYSVGQYSMTFAVNYNNYRISDIVVASDNLKMINSSYEYIGIKSINGVPYYMVKFNFYVPEITANSLGNTGGYIRVGLQSYQNNIIAFGAFVTDITLKNDTSEIIDNQNQNANEIMQNQNENANEIMQNQNENTDKILNDWDGGVDVDDGTTDNFKNAEDAALGGKSDAEIQEEVDNALNFDISVFDSTKIGKIHSLFDNVLDALGSSWQSLFILSLTLGLGAFLIGRRYG